MLAPDAGCHFIIVCCRLQTRNQNCVKKISHVGSYLPVLMPTGNPHSLDIAKRCEVSPSNIVTILPS